MQLHRLHWNFTNFCYREYRTFLLLLQFCKIKDKIEIEALTAFSFTDVGFERLFMSIKLWSISPWSILQMCSCISSAPREEWAIHRHQQKARHMQATQGTQSHPRITSTSRGGDFYAHCEALWENGKSDVHRMQGFWPSSDLCIASVLVRIVHRQCHVRL